MFSQINCCLLYTYCTFVPEFAQPDTITMAHTDSRESTFFVKLHVDYLILTDGNMESGLDQKDKKQKSSRAFGSGVNTDFNL